MQPKNTEIPTFRAAKEEDCGKSEPSSKRTDRPAADADERE